MSAALEMSVATMDDFGEVANLCTNIFNGVDYLPATFTHLVDGPGVEGFVFKMDGEVVAFLSTILLDSDQTLFVPALRVKDSFQHQGLYNTIFDMTFKRASNLGLYPHLRRGAFNSEHWMTDRGCQLVMKTRRTGRTFLASSLSQLTINTTPGQVSALKCEEVKYLFQSAPTHWEHLFPHKQFVIATRLYAVTPDNIPAIQSSGWDTVFYGTTGEDGRYMMLSAGSWHFCQLGVNYLVDLYGTVGEGTEDTSEKAKEHPGSSDVHRASNPTVQGRPGPQAARDHLIAHLRRLQAMRSILPGTVVFDVFASDSVEDVMADVTRELEHTLFTWEYGECLTWAKKIRG